MSGTWRQEDSGGPTRRPRTPTDSHILLIGGTGMLGRAFAAELTAQGRPFTAPPRAQLDLAHPESLKRFTRHATWEQPLTVINCAAWTDVDGAETNQDAAMQVNAEALRSLAALTAIDIPVVNFSTDYVFSGDAIVPYAVDAPRAPINAYGRSKAAGEKTLETFGDDSYWLNIRTSWLYAPWGKNFVLTMKRLLHEKPLVKVVNDQRGRPTSAQQLARTALALLDRGAHGHYHATDGGECTWYEFAAEIKRLTGAPAALEPCRTSDFPRPAARPAYSVLDLSTTEELLGSAIPWGQALEEVLMQAGG